MANFRIETVLKTYCGTAENVRVPNDITQIRSSNFVVVDDDCWRNETMKRIYISDAMKRIPQQLFRCCWALEEVFIPASVEHIEKATTACDNIWSGEFQYQHFSKFYVEKDSYAEAFAIEEGIPYGYIADSNIVWDEEPDDVWKTQKILAEYTGDDEIVIIPEEVQSIDSYAFYQKPVKRIVLHKNIVHIGRYAFLQCDNLSEVIELENTAISDIALDVFKDCLQLKQLMLPKNLDKLSGQDIPWDDISHGHYALREIVIPNGCTSIEKKALYGCESLEKIVIPSSVTHIEHDALPEPKPTLIIWGEKHSYIARKMVFSNYRFQFMDKQHNPIGAEGRYCPDAPVDKLFMDLLQKALDKVGEPAWCYVRDVTIENYAVTNNSDFESMASILFDIGFDLNDNVERLKNEKAFSWTFDELYIRHAIALAIAIRVYICPEASIEINFETSKWSGGNYWWVVSSREQTGREFSKKAGYEQYRILASFPKEYTVKYDADVETLKSVCDAVEAVNVGDKLSVKVLKEYGKYSPCVVLYNSAKKVVGALGRIPADQEKLIKMFAKTAFAIVKEVKPLSARSKGTKYPLMKVDIYLEE